MERKKNEIRVRKASRENTRLQKPTSSDSVSSPKTSVQETPAMTELLRWMHCFGSTAVASPLSPPQSSTTALCGRTDHTGLALLSGRRAGPYHTLVPWCFCSLGGATWQHCKGSGLSNLGMAALEQRRSHRAQWGDSEPTLLIAGPLVPGWPQSHTLGTPLCYPAIRPTGSEHGFCPLYSPTTATTCDRVQYHIFFPHSSLPLLILLTLCLLFVSLKSLWHFSLMEKNNYHIYHSFYEQFCLFNLNRAVGLHKVYQLWSSSSKARKPLEIKASFEYMPYLVIKVYFLDVEE